MDYFEALLQRAASAVQDAAIACRNWEDGGDVDPVSETAWEADGATLGALEVAAAADPVLARATYPETRLGRLLMAARLLVLAGCDEDGRSADLDTAAKVLQAAQRE